MITNSEITSRLGVNPAKWKRWAREFSPLKINKGYRREYKLYEVFKIFICSHLVSVMGFSILDAKTIALDLDDLIREFYSREIKSINDKTIKQLKIEISIYRQYDNSFYYMEKVIYYEDIKLFKKSIRSIVKSKNRVLFCDVKDNDKIRSVLLLSELFEYFYSKIGGDFGEGEAQAVEQD